MKKFYHLLGAVLLTSSAFAQLYMPENSVHRLEYLSKTGANQIAKTPSIQGASKAQYLSEDFEGTFPPTGWTVESGANSTVTVATQEWHKGTEGNPGGAASIYYDNSVDFHDEWLIMPVQNFLTNNASNELRLTWEFYTSQYWHVTDFDNVDITLMVSTDGGLNFTDTIWQEDREDLLPNSFLDIDWPQYEWTTAFTDISAYSGMDNVVFAWNYYGADGARFLMDNVQISDVLANDIITMEMFSADPNLDLEYTKIPLIQTRAISLGADIRNIGSANVTQTGIDFDYVINDGSTDVATGTSATGLTLDVPDNDSIYVETMYRPTALGTYDFSVTAVMDNTDEDLTNNTLATKSLEVTDSVWALDNDILYTSISAGGYVDANGDPTFSGYEFELGIVITTNDTTETRASSISMALSADSTDNIGQFISGKLYAVDPASTTGNIIWTEVAATDFYEITSADLGEFVTLAFINNYYLEPNATYRVVAKAEAFSGNVDFDCSEAIPNGAVIRLDDGSGATWSSTNVTPMVRLNVSDLETTIAASVEENEGDISLGQNFPNPFKGNTTINYSLVNADDVRVEITDITGKVVKVMNEGRRTAGTHSIVLNSNDLPAGLYHYSIVTSNGKVTKAMTVK